MRKASHWYWCGKLLLRLLLVVLLSAATLAQAPATPVSPVDPLPQDTGTLGLKQMLLRLHTTARLMQTTAHPDDEDGGMLTFESRGRGVSTLLMTLTRGEGGQNKLGSNLFDVLGVVRTLELTAADKYYGVQQRFSRVADFGYSKTPEETFQKWQGHDVALGDMVRVIRTFRPDVLIARFSGTQRDGHGHHQASSIVTQEAFRAAADPTKFPEQIKEGLRPWQAKKLYIGNVCGFGASTCPAENYTVKLNAGEFSPALGMSYVQFAINEGLRHQLSQGAGGWTVEPGDRFAFYKLADSVVQSAKDAEGHEKEFFDGIDTNLPGLAMRVGKTEEDWLRPALVKIAADVQKATDASNDPNAAADTLFVVRDQLDAAISRLESSQPRDVNEQDVLEILREKREQAAAALNFALNITLDVIVAPPHGPANSVPPEKDAFAVVSPGQKLTVIAKLHNGSKHPIYVDDAALDPSEGWVKVAHAEQTTIAPGDDYYANFGVQVPPDAPVTRPYWRRDNPETDSLFMVDDATHGKYATLPFPPPPLHVRIDYSVLPRKHIKAPVPDVIQKMRGKKDEENYPKAQISAAVTVPYKDEKGVERKTTLAIAPTFSVQLDPGEQVIPVEAAPATTVKVAVMANLAKTSPGTLRLEVPEGWHVEPARLPVNFHQRGERQEFEFKVIPASLKEGRAHIRAVLSSGGEDYSENYTTVAREDLATFYYYQPAIQRVSMVDVRVPNDLKVGYIMGAGDDIPAVLKQIGMDVTVIAPEKLATEDLSRYSTVVLGIRAYDTQKDVVANNKKLLDFVSKGGTLVVQYDSDTSKFNQDSLTPYPAELSRARVSVEEAPVEILAPDGNLFHYPNQISQKDFEGWVQERGLYFMDKWDEHYKPLLASHDPGEAPQKGGLLRAQYGKGTYIYTGYAFFRQLPAGVPGAIRLYVNILSAGHEKQEKVASSE